MGAFPDTWREDFLAALTFLTRLRFRAFAAPSLAGLANASWTFPLVGLVVGLAGGAVYALALALGLPTVAAALLAVGATALVTGGLHEDGLADTADGFGGGATRDDKLAIMRDSRIGVYGVLALLFSIALRVAALNQIGAGWSVLGALVASHTLARGLLPTAMRLLDPARTEGLGAEAGRPEQSVALAGCGIAAAIALVAAGIRPGLAAVLAAGAAMAGMGWLAQRQIGGQTGDVLGAIEQSGEVASLLAIAAWSS